MEDNTTEFLNFINPTATSSNRNFDKSISLIERRDSSEEEMSYRPEDAPAIARHLSESPTTQPKQNYEELVTCSVCYDEFDSAKPLKLPKILPCQHTYCVECIKNMMHRGVNNEFECPQCKLKVDTLADANTLPTSRIVLALLEKESLNYNGYASCPGCRQIRNLEVCFECNLPLCVQCISKHFDTWKGDVTQNCLNAEEVLKGYKQKIDVLNPLVAQNFETVQSVKNDIEDAFTLLFQRLNTEKEILIKSINDIKEDNSKYVNFKNDIVSLMASFKAFRDVNEKFEKREMTTRMKKCTKYFEDIQKIEKEYASLSSVNFKILEKFDKRIIPELDYNISGNLIINEMALEASKAPFKPSRPAPTQPSHIFTSQNASSTSNLNIPRDQSRSSSIDKRPNSLSKNLASSASTKQTKSSSSNLNDLGNDIQYTTMLSKWVLNSQVKPQSESTVQQAISFMATHENLLFVMDNLSSLTIYEKVYTSEFKLRNSAKLNVPNVRGMAVNGSYVAVAYSGLKKDQLKGTFKNANPAGVILYKREQHVVCTVHEKMVDLSKNESFKNINSIALSDKHLFVCEKELRSVLQYDLKTGSLLKTAVIANGEPYSISVNSSYVCVTDQVNSNLYVFSVDNLEQISGVSLKPIDQVNGALNVLITDENLIFVKTSDNQVTLLDSTLEHRACFNEIQFRVIDMALIKDNSNQMLIVGCMNNKSQYKLFGYAG